MTKIGYFISLCIALSLVALLPSACASKKEAIELSYSSSSKESSVSSDSISQEVRCAYTAHSDSSFILISADSVVHGATAFYNLKYSQSNYAPTARKEVESAIAIALTNQNVSSADSTAVSDMSSSSVPAAELKFSKWLRIAALLFVCILLSGLIRKLKAKA